MLQKEEKNVYVAKNDDTGEKRKPYQSNPVIWIYRFHNLQRRDALSYYFVTFLNYPRFHSQNEAIFFAQKNISFLVTLETVCLKRICNLNLSIICKATRL